MKKLLIALLSINALLIALLTAQAAQAKVKTYDAVKLAQYEKCLDFASLGAIEQGYVGEAAVGFYFPKSLALCSMYRP